MNLIAHTPAPPYYAVIFTSHRTDGDHGYAEMAATMVTLAAQQPGFLGVDVRESKSVTFVMVKVLLSGNTALKGTSYSESTVMVV